MLSAVQLTAMAQSVGNFLLAWKEAPRLQATLTAQWIAEQDGLGQFLQITDAVYGQNTYLITSFAPHGSEVGQMAIVAIKIG